MNWWQLAIEALIPSCSTADELAEFIETHDERGYPLRTREHEAQFQKHLNSRAGVPTGRPGASY